MNTLNHRIHQICQVIFVNRPEGAINYFLPMKMWANAQQYICGKMPILGFAKKEPHRDMYGRVESHFRPLD